MQNTLEFSRKTAPVLREPEAEDGADIWALVRDCKPLDENSMYCNLIQCDHFSDTCIVAELDDEIVAGFRPISRRLTRTLSLFGRWLCLAGARHGAWLQDAQWASAPSCLRKGYAASDDDHRR